MGVRVGVWLAVVLCLAASAAGAALDQPVTVSPGSVTAVDASPALCPTFSWGGVDRAHSYEIVVYALSGSARTAAALGGPPALSVDVPGSASSWTPPADRCLVAGTAYVWFVRALGPDARAGEWSAGAMFRTPTGTATADLRAEVLRIVDRYLAAPRQDLSSGPEVVDRRALHEAVPPPSPSASPLSGNAIVRAPNPAALTAFKAEQPDATGGPTFGVFGISNSNEASSAGVVGHATATTGEVGGVVGFNDSSEGFGILGENSGTAGGVGVIGQDEATSGISAGVAGFTENAEGYGGFFWHADGGDALVVADPTNHPLSVDVKLFVDVDGNLGLVGVVKFEPTDTPTEGCIADTEGSVYYDASEEWLCICTQTSSEPDLWGYRRADDPSDAC